MPELSSKEIRWCYMARVVLTLFIITGKKTFRIFEGWIFKWNGKKEPNLMGPLVKASLSFFYIVPCLSI